MAQHTLKVLPEQDGLRLDIFLIEYALKQDLGLSRSSIQKLIHQGKVSVKGAPILKPHHKVRLKDTITFTPDEKKERVLSSENIPLEVIFEDRDLAVINKPSGLVVHPAPGNYEHTLVNALMHRFQELSDCNPGRPGIVHRLDKETSGLIVIAKNNSAHLKLAKQFSEHSIKRTYIALVKGKVEFDENVIDIPIGRHPVKRKSMAVGFGQNTKYAKTYYKTLWRTKELSLLSLEPFTGRTHQLRVHLTFIGHPIMGDKKYGQNNKFVRLALHAQSLGFLHPRTGKFVQFTSELPVELREFADLT